MIHKQTLELNKATSAEDGKRLWESVKMFFAQSDKPVRVTIEEGGETRKLKQNRLNFLWCGELAEHIFKTQGNVFSSEDLHEYLARKLLPVRVVQINGETVTVRSETKNLTVKEFANYLNRVEFYATEHLGATLTHPDDLYIQALMRGGE